jgi:hypothetical protein
MTETTTTTPKATQSDANKRYTRAVAALKTKYATEFQALLEAEYAKDGVAYKRRLTPAERDTKAVEQARAKAAEKMQQILSIYPDLAPVTAAVQAEAEAV